LSDLGGLSGRSYGPFAFRVSSAQVAAYVEATGDDSQRWATHAPPSFAGAVLFKAAPAFFADPEVSTHARLLIHGEQAFSWMAPWRVGSSLSIEGRVDRLRRRGETAFVTFVVDVKDDRNQAVLSSRSLFLMSAGVPPGGGLEEREEPDPEARRVNARPTRGGKVIPGTALPGLPKSASRSDLVRYAAASEDFNPVHWDHGRGVASGVGGVICHGLLMAAWATQPAAAVTDRLDPLVSGRFRFRRPLYPDTAAEVTAAVADCAGGRANIKTAVVSDAGTHVVATITARTG